jgi:sec-independent protein translocase protein TatA
MIGPLEIAIIAVVLLLIFGYKYLPGLGRRAGEGARDVKESVQEMVGDKADPKTLGKTAGKGLREAREFRDALTGKGEAPEPARSDPQQRSEEPDAASTAAPPQGQEETNTKGGTERRPAAGND